MKRTILVIILLPLIFVLANMIVDFGISVLSGEIDLVIWMSEHKVLLVLIAVWSAFKFKKLLFR